MSAIEFLPAELEARHDAFGSMLSRGEAPKKARAEDIRAEVARAHGLSVTAMMSRSRLPHLGTARRELYRRLREELGWSYPAIGRFAERDHTTILYAIGVRQDGRDRREVAKVRAGLGPEWEQKLASRERGVKTG